MKDSIALWISLGLVIMLIGCHQDLPTEVSDEAAIEAPMGSGGLVASKGGLSGNGGPFEFNPAADTEANSFVLNGVDWNELLGVSEQLLVFGPADAPQNQVSTGEFTLARTPSWIVKTEYPADVRAALEAEGYLFVGDTPAEDFLAKVEYVYVIIDPGTRQERRLVWEGNDTFRFGSVAEYGIGTSTNIFINGWVMANPQNPGEHMVGTGYSLSAPHYDGFPDLSDTCPPAGVLCEDSFLQAGEHETPRFFTVNPGPKK